MHDVVGAFVEGGLGLVGAIGLWLLKTWKADHELRSKNQMHQFETSIRNNNAMVGQIMEKFEAAVKDTSKRYEDLVERLHKLELAMAKQSGCSQTESEQMTRAVNLLSESVRQLTRLQPQHIGEDAYRMTRKKE